jgi:hypothetical protein
MKTVMRRSWRFTLAVMVALGGLLASPLSTHAAVDPIADVTECTGAEDQVGCLAAVVSDSFALIANEDATTFAISGRDIVFACVSFDAATFEAIPPDSCVAATAQALVSTCGADMPDQLGDCVRARAHDLLQPASPRVRTIGPAVVVSPFAQPATAAPTVEGVQRFDEPIVRRPLPPGPPNRLP